MENSIEVRHVAIKVNLDYDNFTKKIESALGRFDHDIYREIEKDPNLVIENLKKMAGEENLMLFDVQDHGKLLKILGLSKKAKQYVLGNPLIAIQMTRYDIRAGLYAPIRMLVYEFDKNFVIVEYDLPSSLFGQFNHPEVTKISKTLDQKLERLIEKVQKNK